MLSAALAQLGRSGPYRPLPKYDLAARFAPFSFEAISPINLPTGGNTQTAPPRGTVLSVPHLNIVQDGLLNSKLRFNPGKFQWIGRLREQQQVGVASSKSNVPSRSMLRGI